ncbi:FIP1-like protein [Trypanosoma rangeli]|uniref:FIP1-like protein n=1 Tax=Trypanosoma rangeli TaxID=5698 RepID=A0A3R7NRF3_TRYRA|nr:FIP1-like protein [Trypanosoma rangeli]RNF10486.1 FIP1-like protein [Trypanosoma rangeli]|eukprot:RNF10486.1 FIP1-like protein [Trypanosoma rangeli]
MADTEENPFVGGHTAETAGPSLTSVESPPPAAAAGVRGGTVTDEPHGQEQQQDVEPKGDVSGLIPLCVRHAGGPQVNSTVFGYDIAQMQKRPWDEPAANLKDYFNYGFNETSWRLYCAMQTGGEASPLPGTNTFFSQQASSAVKNTALEEGVEGDGVAYHMPPQGSSHGYYAAPRDSFLKTKLCQRFAVGRCVKGDQCSYAHGHGELRSVPSVHHHHHHHQLQQPPPCVLQSFQVDQGFFPPMGMQPTGVLERTAAGSYHMMPKRQRSPDGGGEDKVYDASY